MKLAIMQPYFVPYIGYWQLLGIVDRFVVYDDVTYIKGGWINRNRILSNGKSYYITVPLNQSSSYKKICDISLQSSPIWRRKMIKSIENTYRKAPFFSDIFPTIKNIISYPSENLADFLVHNIASLATFMGIKTEIVMTSRCYQNNNLNGQDRILDICMREGATTYINSQGGQTLYDSEIFHNRDLTLHFIEMCPLPYKQRSAGFVPYLSIIDALMELGVVEIMQYLTEFDLYESSPHVT